MSNTETPQTTLWSDFDGTAIKIARAPYINPKNWLKTGLAGIPGYRDFLDGAIEGGLAIGGVVSRRPDIAIRRYATQLAINYQDLYPYFDPPSQVVLAGSEEAKAGHLVYETYAKPVAIIDDKPHKIGALLAKRLASLNQIHAMDRDFVWPPLGQVTLGGVANEQQSTNIAALLTGLTKDADFTGVPRPDIGAHDIMLANSLQETPLLRVVYLQPYSHDAGLQFAQTATAA